MRAAIYCRVSTSGQEDNSSLDTQEAACRSHAAERGWTVVAVYREVHTGVELFERPQLTDLRGAMRQGAFDVLLVHALDRLSRKQTHQGLILSEAEHAGVEWESVTEDIDNSPQGQILRAVIGGMAELERLKIAERTQRGKAARLAAGKPSVGPRPPYGYQWTDEQKTRLVENPETAPVVRRMFCEIASGSSGRQVAIRLSADGVPTPTGKATWATATITQLLRNPVYTGNLSAQRYHRERVKGHTVMRHGQSVPGKGWRYGRRSAAEAVALPDAAPALVAPDLAAAAVARLSINRREATRNNRDPEAALLRAGFAICGYCGGHLQAITHHTNGTFYRCNQANRDTHGCPGFSIMAHTLDDAIWPGVCARLLNRDLVASELERLRREDPTGADMTALSLRLREVERKQANLRRALAVEDNTDVAALIRADMASHAADKRRLDQECDALERQQHAWHEAQNNLRDLEHWMHTVAGNLDGADYQTRRLALAACRVQVKVWATDHSPRWHATMQLGDGPAFELVETTSWGCTRCSRRHSRGG